MDCPFQLKKLKKGLKDVLFPFSTPYTSNTSQYATLNLSTSKSAQFVSSKSLSAPSQTPAPTFFAWSASLAGPAIVMYAPCAKNK